MRFRHLLYAATLGFGLVWVGPACTSFQSDRGEKRPTGREVAEEAGEATDAADRDDLVLYSTSIEDEEQAEDEPADEDLDEAAGEEPADADPEAAPADEADEADEADDQSDDQPADGEDTDAKPGPEQDAADDAPSEDSPGQESSGEPAED